ncbi:endolytic transglycosylase MltG [Kumtagia ephedrae]|uniref:Endolytic murein transglycosylase n=1 Tax=Kumtagia ephedrae TaxID=2116701 RepID=A0A2P7SET6_9HYPH|nr:endolytic transglycosylase MltG [Mesorhizobium ephedrae]PSJ61022.1 endolytic transglycosylase MltG [Mesorhizobium ephedrae]
MSDTQTPPAEFGRRPEPPKPEEEAAKPKAASEALRPQPAAQPAAPRRSRASRNQIVVFMNFLISLVMLAIVAAGAAVVFGKRAFEAPGPTTEARTFLVRPNSGVGQIATQLEQNGLISDATVFRLGVRSYGGEATMKAGEYEVQAGASMHDIMKLLQSGRSIMYSLTIPEGLTVAQAFRRIAEAEALAGDMPTEIPPEGSLAADTQRFTRGAERKVIIDKMLAQQKALIEEVWAKRQPDLPVADVNEFVTLASIVEKETGIDAERPQVAAVFVNRLRKKMRLQSDPTIIYGLFGGAGKPADRPIYQSDIEKPTPYNTYVINGLPPGPIANPGRAALEAVANPADTEDLYFVADGTGGHVFARTLQEHNRNVARWRAFQKQQAEAAKAGAQDGAGQEAQPAQ